MNFSEEQILSMAPDESSKKSGKELANPSKWVKREGSDRALWGECQGSGKNPYQTQIDLSSIAFKCSCPSRKFPCKHGLGLLLLYARDQKLFTRSSEPHWVTEWLDKRNEREEKKTVKAEKEKQIDPAAQAKRQENRLRRVEDGMAELRLWVQDIIRNGLINIPSKDPSYFEGIARRMVDAQAPGLAAMVRTLRDINFFREGWQTPFMDQLARIYLALEGFTRIETLSEELQNELKTLIGFTQNQEELKAEHGVRDEWFVLAKRIDKEDNLTTERNWLYGIHSKKYALILQFYVKGQLPDLNLVSGSMIDAELVYFKGANPIRALVKQHHSVLPTRGFQGFANWSDVLAKTSEANALNPWISFVPAVVENIVPVKNSNQWVLKDSNGEGVVLSHHFEHLWKLVAISGGKPLRIFAVGRETSYEPMAAWVDERYILLT